MPFSYIEYKGKKILFVDYSDCKTTDAMLHLLNNVVREYRDSKEKFLVVNDFSNANASHEFVNFANKHRDLFDEKTEKTAVLGITGLKRLLLNGYNVFVKKKQVPFNTKEEALEYLIS